MTALVLRGSAPETPQMQVKSAGPSQGQLPSLACPGHDVPELTAELDRETRDKVKDMGTEKVSCHLYKLPLPDNLLRIPRSST